MTQTLEISDLITITPLGKRTYEVVALDELYGEYMYARPVDGEEPAQWHSLTYVSLLDDEPEDVSICHCGHQDCGAC